MMESEIVQELKIKAERKNLSMAEYCRQKLKGSEQLDRIEFLLQKFKIIKPSSISIKASE